MSGATSNGSGVTGDEEPSPLFTFRQCSPLEPDVLVLSLATFAFSLDFRVTNRFLPEDDVALGGTAFVVDRFGTAAPCPQSVWSNSSVSVADSPTVAFAIASGIGLVGTGYFPVYGEKFGPYARN